MAKIKDTNFLQISFWMVSELELKGNELFVYALIHGFCQDGKSVFRGGLEYICTWLSCTEHTAISALKSLLEKGFIKKKITEVKGSVRYVEYWTMKSREKGDDRESCVLVDNYKNEQNPDIKDKTASTKESHDCKNFSGKENSHCKNYSGDDCKNFSGTTANFTVINSSKLNLKNSLSQNNSQELNSKPEKTEREIFLENELTKFFGNLKIFSDGFVQELDTFIARNNFPCADYIAFTYNTLKNKKISNFAAYFYKTAISESNAALYAFEKSNEKAKASGEQASEPMKIPEITCPSCGKKHRFYDDCPDCGLMANERKDARKIELYRRIFNLAEDKKQSLTEEIDECRKKLFHAENIFMVETELNKIYEKYGVLS